MYVEQTELMQKQVAQAAGFAEALKGADTDEVTDKIKQMSDALKEVEEQASSTGSGGEKMSTDIAKSLLKIKGPVSAVKTGVELLGKKFPIAAAGAAAFVDGVISGFKFVIASLTAAADLAAAIVVGFADVSFAILRMPFAALEGLIQVSNRLTAIMEAIARATEEVRTQFGELAKGPGQAVLDMARNVGKGFEDLGLSGFRVFGSLDERIQAVNRIATEMGVTFETFRGEMMESGNAILLMQRGLGLSGDQMGFVAQRAKAFGKTLVDELEDITQHSTSFGEAFGLSAKGISRDIGEMVKDVRHFASMTPRELAKVSVHAKKLGIDFKNLLGLIDKFDTFEDAAISTAMLSQAFGVQADTMKLMRAESPVDRVEELRRAFFQAGKSADSFNRQQLKLLAQTTGLDEATARTAFSHRNMGVSMQDLEKQGKISEKRQLTTAEAVEKLSSAIERMIKPFGQFQTVLGAFADGFARGIFMQEDFRAALTKLNRSLASVKRAGIEVGKMFVEMFPGVKDLVSIFSKLLDISDERGPFMMMLSDIKFAFKTLFEGATDPAAIEQFFLSIRWAFEDFLKGIDAGAVSQSLDKIVSATAGVMSGVIEVVTQGIEQAVDVLVGFISGDELPDTPGAKLAKKLVQPIIDAFSDGGAIDRIGGALKKLFTTIWEKHGDKIKDVLMTGAKVALAVIFGPAVLQAIIAMAGTFLSSIFAGWLTGGGLSTLASVGSSIAAVVFNPVVWIPAVVAAFAGASVGVSKGMDKFNDKLRDEVDGSIGDTEVRMGAAVAGILDMLTFGIFGDDAALAVGGWIANISTALLDGIDDLFGGNVAENLRDAIDSSIAVFSTFGDLLSALWEGDTDKIIGTATEFGKSLMNYFISFFTDQMPAIIEMGLKAVVALVKFSFWTVPKWLIMKFIPAMGGVIYGMGVAIVEAFGDVWSSIEEAVGSWIDGASTHWGDKLFEWAGDIFSVDKWLGFGKNICKGVGQALGAIGDVMTWPMRKAIDAVKDVLGIKSPSTVFAEIGDSMLKGLVDAFSAGPRLVGDIVSKIPGVSHIYDSLFDDDAAAGKIGVGKSPAVAVVQGMMDEAMFIEDAVKKLGDINLEACLKELAGNLGIDAKKVTVNRGPINMNVTLSVHMDLEEVTTLIEEQGKFVRNENSRRSK